MEKVRYLTFDCYGTLVDWRSGIEKALVRIVGPGAPRGAELASVYGRLEKQEETPYKRYRDVLKNTARALGRTVGVEVTESQAAEFAESLPGWPVFPDTTRSLRRFGEMGLKRFILSNVDDDLLSQTIANGRLEVDGFVTAQETRSYKPSHGHWERFMAKTGASRVEFLHVGQSVYHDMIPAQEIGIASAWVNRYAEPLPVAAQPSYIVDSLDSLVRIIG